MKFLWHGFRAAFLGIRHVSKQKNIFSNGRCTYFRVLRSMLVEKIRFRTVFIQPVANHRRLTGEALSKCCSQCLRFWEKRTLLEGIGQTIALNAFAFGKSGPCWKGLDKLRKNIFLIYLLYIFNIFLFLLISACGHLTAHTRFIYHRVAVCAEEGLSRISPHIEVAMSWSTASKQDASHSGCRSRRSLTNR